MFSQVLHALSARTFFQPKFMPRQIRLKDVEMTV